MFKKFKKQINNEKGLTLIELLAVIVILAIVAAIAIPAIGNIITNSKVNALKADGQNVLAAASMYFVENGEVLEVTTTKLIEEGFLDDAGGFTNSAATVYKSGREVGESGSPSSTDSNTLDGTAGKKTTAESTTFALPNVVFTKATNADISAAGTTDADSGANLTINR